VSHIRASCRRTPGPGSLMMLSAWSPRCWPQGLNLDERNLLSLMLAHANVPRDQRNPSQAALTFRQLVSRGTPVNAQVIDALGRAVGRNDATALVSELGINLEAVSKASKPWESSSSWDSSSSWGQRGSSGKQWGATWGGASTATRGRQ